MYHKKGFTLIELLVVVFIIGLLATIVIVATTTARSNARDNRRKADLNSIAIALESYKAVNKEYIKNNYIPGDATYKYKKEEFLQALKPDFITGSIVPNDPMYDSYVSQGYATKYHAYEYKKCNFDVLVPCDKTAWGSSDKGYELYGWLENSNDADVTKKIGQANGYTESGFGIYMLVK